jgi:hypothetical protein
MDVNCAIDDLIDNLEPLKPNSPRLAILYHKLGDDLDRLLQVRGGFGSSTTSWRMIWIVYYKSELDLHHLPQVGGVLATVHQRAPVPTDYSDFINNTLTLSNGHQGLRAPPTWLGGLRNRTGTESSKLPSSAHFFYTFNLVGGL